jgi:hypothetical protein
LENLISLCAPLDCTITPFREDERLVVAREEARFDKECIAKFARNQGMAAERKIEEGIFGSLKIFEAT